MIRLRQWSSRSIGIVITALAAGGCGSLDSVAPRVAPGRGATADTLEEGRRIFIGACTTCHAASPVAKYSTSEWSAIVSTMAPRTKLKPSREAALLAYLTAARAMPDRKSVV